jgi:hypothetical protein
MTRVDPPWKPGSATPKRRDAYYGLGLWTLLIVGLGCSIGAYALSRDCSPPCRCECAP